MSRGKKNATAAPTALPKGIRQRANGRFMVDITIGGTRKTAVASTVGEAIEKREAMKADLVVAAKNGGGEEAQKIIARGGWTLKQAFDRALADFWRGKSSEGTNTINSNAALAFFGADKLIATLTQADIDAYIDHLEEMRNADATINRKMSSLGRMLEAAKRRGHKPAEELTMARRRERVGRIRFLTEKEERNLLTAFENLDKQDHREAVIVLLDTGFRTGELWRLQASHVDFTRNTITLWETKNFQARTIPMTTRVRDIIARRCVLYPEGQLFPGSGKVWMRAPWDNARKLLNMEDDPDFVPHMLRHTCCSRLVQRGVPLAHVKAWMGHLDIKTTMRYAHLTPHDLFSAVSVLEGGDQARWEQAQQLQQQQIDEEKQLRQ